MSTRFQIRISETETETSVTPCPLVLPPSRFSVQHSHLQARTQVGSPWPLPGSGVPWTD